MGSGVELQGGDEMIASIRRRLASGVQRLENQGLREVGEILAEAQRQMAPRSDFDKVHIQDDIKVSPVRREDGMKVIRIGPSKRTSWRAHLSEFGSKNNQAHPFIYPSFHENKARVIQLLASVQREGMR
ncbi:hypothetical protein D3C74_384700 [compost metagenome]